MCTLPVPPARRAPVGLLQQAQRLLLRLLKRQDGLAPLLGRLCGGACAAAQWTRREDAHALSTTPVQRHRQPVPTWLCLWRVRVSITSCRCRAARLAVLARRTQQHHGQGVEVGAERALHILQLVLRAVHQALHNLLHTQIKKGVCV